MDYQQDMKQVIMSVIDEEIEELKQLLHTTERLHDEQTRNLVRLNEKALCLEEAIRMHRLMNINNDTVLKLE